MYQRFRCKTCGKTEHASVMSYLKVKDWHSKKCYGTSKYCRCAICECNAWVDDPEFKNVCDNCQEKHYSNGWFRDIREKDPNSIPPHIDEYLKKYAKRTGIFRLHRVDTKKKKSHLILEFAIRGKSLFYIKTWRTRYPFDRKKE